MGDVGRLLVVLGVLLVVVGLVLMFVGRIPVMLPIWGDRAG